MDMVREIGRDDVELDGEGLNENEPDLPPEYCHYHDDGCEFARACLSCPFPHCLDDEPRGKQHWLKEQRNREIARLFGSGSWGVRELALRFGLSQRTIQRALKSTLSLSLPRLAVVPEEKELIGQRRNGSR